MINIDIRMKIFCTNLSFYSGVGIELLEGFERLVLLLLFPCLLYRPSRELSSLQLLEKGAYLPFHRFCSNKGNCIDMNDDVNTVFPLLETVASNYFDEILAQNLLSKNCVLVCLLFKGSFYLRAASNKGSTVCTVFDI